MNAAWILIPAAERRAPGEAVRTRKRRSAWSRALLAAALGACSGRDDTAPAGQARPLGELVEWVGDVRLAERPDAISVTPMVALDPAGGFLVADQREAQIRRYGVDGELLWSSGRKGAGPGEFAGPVAAVRLASGDVLAMDRTGRLTQLNSAGARIVRTVETNIRHGEELLVLDDSTVIVGGVLNEMHDGPRLHLWDVRGDSVRASFFSPLRNARNRSVANVTGWAKASVRGDTIAVVFATSDTVYFYSRAGRALGQVPVPSGYFRRGPAEGPRRTIADPAEKARWMSRFDFAEAVYWLADGTLLVAYQSVDPDRALERNRHLVRMTRSGELLFETRDGPRLLEVDGGTSTLVFVHPDAEVPDRWALGRVRR